MANPVITDFPQKTINGYLSKWNASALPITYTITNDKFPGTAITNYYTEIEVIVNGVSTDVIEQVPDQNKETKVDVRKAVQTALDHSPAGGLNDTNSWATFRILAWENYIDTYGVAQRNPASGGSADFYASLSALPFGTANGGNMYDYLADNTKPTLAKWLTDFERGYMVDYTDYVVSILIETTPFSLLIESFDINGNQVAMIKSTIADLGRGLYRIFFGSFELSAETKVLNVQAVYGMYDTPLSEILYIDVDTECLDVQQAPIDFMFFNPGMTTLDFSFIPQSGDKQTGFRVLISKVSDFSVIEQTLDLGATVTSGTASGLDSDTLYYGKVKALGDVSSPFSNIDSLSTIFDFGNALKADGINDYVRANAISAVAFNPDMAVCAWVKFSSLASGSGDINAKYIWATQSGGVNGFVSLRTEEDAGLTGKRELVFRMHSTTVNITAVSAECPVNDMNVWHHVAVQMMDIDGSSYNCKIWFDGVELTSTDTPFTGSYPATYGTYDLYKPSFGPSNSLDAVMDQFVHSVNFDLEPVISSIYNSGMGTNINNVIPPANQLVNFEFNESTGNTASDSSGNSYDGTLVNFTAVDADKWVVSDIN